MARLDGLQGWASERCTLVELGVVTHRVSCGGCNEASLPNFFFLKQGKRLAIFIDKEEVLEFYIPILGQKAKPKKT
jgi:hypothetical protein